MNVRMSDSLQRKSNMENIVDSVLTAFLNDKILEKLDLEEPGTEVTEDFFVLREENRSRIIFYKNSIIHYYVPVAFYASVLLLLNGKTELSLENVKTEFTQIKEMFSHEFIYPEATKEEEQERILYDYLISESLIERTGAAVTLTERGTAILPFFSKIIRDYLESYYVVLHTVLHESKTRVSRKDLVINIRKTGIKMFHTGDIALAESLSLPNYNNALAMIENRNAIIRHDAGKKSIEMEITDRRLLEIIMSKITEYLKVIG
jgi:glycerol-3-phosphate O-acyltransferase